MERWQLWIILISPLLRGNNPIDTSAEKSSIYENGAGKQALSISTHKKYNKWIIRHLVCPRSEINDEPKP